jgi:hypothetical protein
MQRVTPPRGMASVGPQVRGGLAYLGGGQKGHTWVF